jgi:hypothetical protein
MAISSVDRIGYRMGWWSTHPLDAATLFQSPQTFHCDGDTCITLFVAWIILFALCLAFQFGLFDRCGIGKYGGAHQHGNINGTTHHHHYYDPNHSSASASAHGPLLSTNNGTGYGAGHNVYDPQMSDRQPLLPTNTSRAYDERRA